MKAAESKDYKTEQGTAVKPGYYVIIGSFGSKDNAKRLKKKITDSGNNVCSVMFYEKINFHRVSYSYSENAKESLSTDILKLRTEGYPDAWILHLK